MRNFCFLFICLSWLISCTSEQKEPEQKASDTSQTTVINGKENTIPETTLPATEANATNPEPFIIPGKSIGLIKLNEYAEVVKKLLGEPTSANAGMGKSLQTWTTKTAEGKTQQISIFFGRNMGNEDEKSRVKQIRITDAAFKTDAQNYATVGVLRGNIQEAKKMTVYTLPGVKGQFKIYDNLKTGIAYEFDPPGNVIAITVHEPGKPAFEVFSEVSSDLKKVEPAAQTTLPFPGIKD